MSTEPTPARGRETLREAAERVVREFMSDADDKHGLRLSLALTKLRHALEATPPAAEGAQALTDYWLEHYVNQDVGLCSLCGNTGEIDTIATAVSPAGVPAGRRQPCICPNGQSLREKHHGDE